MRSGPQDFVTFRLSSTSLTSSVCIMIESKGAWVRGTWCGRVLFSSLTTDCEAKYLFIMLAFCKSVSAYSLFNARVGILFDDFSSFRICFDVFQNSFEFEFSLLIKVSNLSKYSCLDFRISLVTLFLSIL